MFTAITIMIFTLGFFKLLNWIDGKKINWKGYFLDFTIDALFIVIFIYLGYLINKISPDIEYILISTLFLVIIFPGIIFYLKKNYLKKNSLFLKWYYPINDILILVISLFAGGLLWQLF